jgi:uncharacterized protein (DUF1778 family)
MARTKHRKQVRKEDSIRVRVTTEQKKTLEDAAERAGLGVSSWLLTTGLRIAKNSA